MSSCSSCAFCLWPLVRAFEAGSFLFAIFLFLLADSNSRKIATEKNQRIYGSFVMVLSMMLFCFVHIFCFCFAFRPHVPCRPVILTKNVCEKLRDVSIKLLPFCYSVRAELLCTRGVVGFVHIVGMSRAFVCCVNILMFKTPMKHHNLHKICSIHHRGIKMCGFDLAIIFVVVGKPNNIPKSSMQVAII